MAGFKARLLPGAVLLMGGPTVRSAVGVAGSEGAVADSEVAVSEEAVPESASNAARQVIASFSVPVLLLLLLSISMPLEHTVCPKQGLTWLALVGHWAKDCPSAASRSGGGYGGGGRSGGSGGYGRGRYGTGVYGRSVYGSSKYGS